jgi:multiple sugar transport system ATP-binding protein
MRAELKRFQRDLETTTIYVTHDQAEAMTLADRVAIMSNGRLQQLGPPKEVYNRPANMFVAGFLGSPPMNFLSVEIESRADQLHLKSVSVDLPVPTVWKDQLGSLPSGKNFVLGIRPEDVTVSPEQKPYSIPAEVYVVEDLGNERLVDLRVDGQPAVARIDGRFEPAIGDRVWISFSPDDSHVFDPKTEQQLLTREKLSAAPA